MAMDGEILLNTVDTSADLISGSDTISHRPKARKVEYESKRLKNVKQRRAKEFKRRAKIPAKHEAKRNKERKKEDSGYANVVLKGDVLPSVFPNENKLVFPHLALNESLTGESIGIRERKNARTGRSKFRGGNSNKSNRKSNDPQNQEKTKNVTNSGDTFASFVSRSTVSNDTAKGHEAMKRFSGKFVRMANRRHDSSKNEFKFAFDDLTEGKESQNVVDFPDTDIPVIEPNINFRSDDSANRTKHTKSKKFEKNPHDITSPRKSSKRHFASDSDSEIDLGGGNDDDEWRLKAKRMKKGGKGSNEGKNEDEAVQWRGRHTSLFCNNPEIPTVGRRVVQPVHEPVFTNETFADLPIHKFLVSNLSSLGLTRLLTVQRKAVPLLLEGRDALVRSQTGSGKTLAYALPLVELLQRQRPELTRSDGVRALVVLPTRELALQTYEWFLKLVKPFMRLVPGCLVGGEKRKSEKARLRKGITILVGTPGRILDHLHNTRCLRLNKVQYLVLDEADCLLDLGYERDVGSIISELESETQPLLSENVLEWNRKTYKNENDTSTGEDRSEKNKNKVASYASEDSGAGDEKSGDNTNEENDFNFSEDEEDERELLKRTVETKQLRDDKREVSKEEVLKTTVDVKQERKEEDETSDYDPEERADEVLDAKELKRKWQVGDEGEGADGWKERLMARKKRRAKRAQLSGSEEEARPPKAPGRWQTVLLSATLTPAVERMAGLALRSPAFVDAASADAASAGSVNADAAAQDVVIPDSLAQYFMVVPAKLRLVTLSAFIVWKCKFTEGRKMLLFCATQDMVDYMTELLTVGLSRKDTDEEEYSSDDDFEDPEDNLNVGVDFFRLHGNMDHKERTHVFRTFREAECGVLLCTDVAARGLDLPHVDWIVQYTAPISVSDYVHRVGRTARVGAAGSALLFLLPTEADFVQLLQDRRINLQAENMDSCLKKLALANGSTKTGKLSSLESAATALQLRYENAVLARRSLHESAIKAYVSFVRFYASYPRDMREVFCFKSLHLGHSAKSFALRDPPKTIAGIGRRRYHLEQEQQSGKRPKQHDGPRQRGPKVPKGFAPSRRRTQELVLSEFASGL